MKYGLRVFREGTVIDDNLHGKRCNQLFIQMNGCNILLMEDLKVEENTNIDVVEETEENYL
jgi:hypothetical protein